MKKKYILPLLILTGVFVGGVTTIKYNYDNSSNEKSLLNELSVETYQTHTYLSSDIIENSQKATSYAEFVREFTPEYMLNIADAVAVVSVISVDSADTKYNQAVGNTYGTMVINNSIYGSLTNGTVINYMKSGGTMTLEEYDKYQLPEMREKHEMLRKQSGIDATKVYVNMHFENDPDIEEGKSYLCYLKYIDSIEKYEIIGLGNGFREINIPQSRSVSSQSINTSEYKILNNNTGKFESLSEYINKYINI